MKILIGALFLSLWQSLLFWKQDLGISVLLFTIPIIWITTKLLKGNIKNKKALLISIPIIILSRINSELHNIYPGNKLNKLKLIKESFSLK